MLGLIDDRFCMSVVGKPSIRKLFDRTAPPPIDSAELPVWSCMRFQCALPLATTVGSSVASRNTLRPSEGSSRMFSLVIVLLCEALLVSMSGACAVTVTLSSMAPTCSVTGMSS